MPLLNYTTTISAEKTTTEIQKILAKAKARAIVTEYDDDGVLSSMAFQIMFNGQPIYFKLPARIDPIHIILKGDYDVPKRLKTREQAARVTWRIIKEWIQSQLALVEADQVSMTEVFLPYAQDPSGRTVYERLEQTGFQQLLTHDTEGET